MEIMEELLIKVQDIHITAQNGVEEINQNQLNANDLLNNNHPPIAPVNPQTIQDSLKRCQTFLTLNLFRKSLQLSESVLKSLPDWTPENEETLNLRLRAIDLKGKALLGLGEYEETLIYLGKESQSLKNFGLTLPPTQTAPHKEHLQHWKYLVERGKVLQRLRITGDIDMGDFLPNKKVRLDVDSVVEYQDRRIQIGAVIEGKGRGVLALEDIPKGALILSTRAFEIIFDTEDEDDDLENSIQMRMKLDPTLIPEVYVLHAGKELGYFPLNSSDNARTIIDLKRIAGICTMNSFGNSRNSSGYGHNSRGLWTKASFFNHDCLDFNSMWKVLGDFLFVRTIQDVKKGDELLIAYTDTAEAFEERAKFFQAHDFSCACRLCQYQSKEDLGIRGRRLEILKQLNVLDEKDRKNCSTLDLQNDIQFVEGYLEELERLGSGRPQWNFSPHVALDLLTKLYLKSGDSAKYKEMAARYYLIVNCAGAATEKIDKNDAIVKLVEEHRQRGPCLEVGAAGQVAAVFLKSGDFPGAQKWINILRQDLTLVYGRGGKNGDGDDALKKLYPQLYAQAEKHGLVSENKS